MKNTVTKQHCLNCGAEIGSEIMTSHGWRVFDGMRSDKRFCSAKCRAAHHREHGATNTHGQAGELIGVQCAVCGELFEIGLHAHRHGQRQALYCSGKCRQKAYRQRKKNR